MHNEKLALKIVLIITTFLLIGIVYLAYHFFTTTRISSFEECERAGYPVTESYPRQCRADKRTFIQAD